MAREMEKDPQAVLDYSFDWSEWLAEGDTITTSTMTVETGLTQDSSENTTTVAKVWVSGGTLGERYNITNSITTAQGRTDNRTIVIRVAER